MPKKRLRQAVSLVELLVVLAILAGMVSLLLPAVQRARAAARSSVCLNNLRQIRIAAASHQELGNEFPHPRQSWTITLLQWLEERPLMESIASGNGRAPIGNRPPIYKCPDQLDQQVDETGIRAAHYTLEMTRNRKGKWLKLISISDRRRDFEGEELRPWTTGPITTPIPQSDLETMGPHSGILNRHF